MSGNRPNILGFLKLNIDEEKELTPKEKDQERVEELDRYIKNSSLNSTQERKFSSLSPMSSIPENAGVLFQPDDEKLVKNGGMYISVVPKSQKNVVDLDAEKKAQTPKPKI